MRWLSIDDSCASYLNLTYSVFRFFVGLRRGDRLDDGEPSVALFSPSSFSSSRLESVNGNSLYFNVFFRFLFDCLLKRLIVGFFLYSIEGAFIWLAIAELSNVFYLKED